MVDQTGSTDLKTVYGFKNKRQIFLSCDVKEKTKKVFKPDVFTT